MDSNALGIENCLSDFMKGGSETPCVRVDLRSSDGPNDLLSCLSTQLGLEPPPLSDSANTTPPSSTSQAQALVAPSAVIAFELVRPSHSSHKTSQQNSAFSTPSVVPFRYPMSVYLDQFLLENASTAGEKRHKKREMELRLKELTIKRESLTRFEVGSVACLRRSTYCGLKPVTDKLPGQSYVGVTHLSALLL